MEKHVIYWTEKAGRGIAIVFGPVLDPAGVYGMGVYKVEDEAEMHRLRDADPANGLLQYEAFPMPRVAVGESQGKIDTEELESLNVPAAKGRVACDIQRP